MLGIPGLGPKKVKAMNDKLGIETLEQLEAACREGKVAVLDGFGEKSLPFERGVNWPVISPFGLFTLVITVDHRPVRNC